jgi:hypothetical protein
MDCKLCGKLNLTFADWYTEDCPNGPNGHQCEPDIDGRTIPAIYTIDDMPDDPEEYYNDRAERMP